MASTLSPAQIRGARAMLNWSMTDISKTANVSVSKIKRIQDGAIEIVSDAAVAAIREAFEAKGIRFLPDDGSGPGIRLNMR